jgi:hypothetical protein
MREGGAPKSHGVSGEGGGGVRDSVGILSGEGGGGPGE